MFVATTSLLDGPFSFLPFLRSLREVYLLCFDFDMQLLKFDSNASLEWIVCDQNCGLSQRDFIPVYHPSSLFVILLPDI